MAPGFCDVTQFENSKLELKLELCNTCENKCKCQPCELRSHRSNVAKDSGGNVATSVQLVHIFSGRTDETSTIARQSRHVQQTRPSVKHFFLSNCSSCNVFELFFFLDFVFCTQWKHEFFGSSYYREFRFSKWIKSRELKERRGKLKVGTVGRLPILTPGEAHNYTTRFFLLFSSAPTCTLIRKIDRWWFMDFRSVAKVINWG